jgi:hypothetical protein
MFLDVLRNNDHQHQALECKAIEEGEEIENFILILLNRVCVLKSDKPLLSSLVVDFH